MAKIIGMLIVFFAIIKIGITFFVISTIGSIIWFVIKYSKKEKSNEQSTMDDPIIFSDQYTIKNNDFRLQEKQIDSDSFWNGKDKDVIILNYTISEGMVYVGEGLSAVCGYGIECALIDPKLPIKNNHDLDYRTRRMDYWPSYSKISPEARGAYLEWLSSGKADTEADIGYIFLYFYGLERRLLHDSEYSCVTKNEIDTICTEIERLLAIYSGNRSFYAYASSLLNYVKADEYSKSTIYKKNAPVPTYHQGFPVELKIGLGQMARDGVAIPFDWALSWYLSSPNPPVYARTAAQRCKEEFRTMFAEEYTKNFGEGLNIKPNKTQITCSYQVASRSLNTYRFKKTLELPDVTVLTSHIKKLAPMIQLCHDRLDKYSRYLGRNPDKIATFDALLEMPASCWPEFMKNAITQIKLDIAPNSNPVEMKLSAFIATFPEWKDRSKKRMVLFLDALSSQYHLGLEPDCRYGGVVPDLESKVFIFKLETNGSTDMSSNFNIASLAMYMAILVAQVDDNFAEDERVLLLSQAEKWINLNNEEKQRLKARILWLSSQKLNMANVKKRIHSLAANEKEIIICLLIRVAQIDGIITVEEVKLIERISKLMGIEESSLYSKMHQAAIEPVTIMSPAPTNSFSIPVQSVKNHVAETVQLDMSKVVALQADSEKITSILSGIFNQEESVEDTIPSEQMLIDKSKTEEKVEGTLWGLSPALSEFVYTLSGKPLWKRTELVELAQDRNILLEGTLEQINEVAFDHFDQSLIEGDDAVEINQEIVKVMWQ